MKLNRLVLSIGLFALLASPVAAADCTYETTIGDFEVSLEDASFNGHATEFEYCFTGLDTPALSDWVLALDPACLGPDDIRRCGAEPCYHQVDDPHSGTTGIKFDDVTVNPGEEVCYRFSLVGDWTGMLDDVTIALKAGEETHVGEICGPACIACSASLQVLQADGDGTLTVFVNVIHNRPPTSFTEVVYQIQDRGGNVVHEWTDGPVELSLGQRYHVFGPVPNQPTLEPGNYTLMMEMRGMSSWVTQQTRFRVIEE
jgi:hypothetical protein